MSIPGLVLAIILFLAGLAGTVLPVLPGAPLILLGMVVYGLFTGFAKLTWGFFIWQAVAVALTFFIDYLASVWGVRRSGGSKAALWGSVIGLVAGVLVLGPAGIILGPFLGAFLGEILVKKDVAQALRTGVGSLVGLLGGTVLKLAIELVMIAWFLTVIF